MPQMAPLSWLLMFSLFICALMMFLLKNYFIKTIKLIKNKNKKTNIKFNWKW